MKISRCHETFFLRRTNICFAFSHWSFVQSLDDRRHNVKWWGGTAASHTVEKSWTNATFVKMHNPLSGSTEDSYEEAARGEKGAFPIGLLSKVRMTLSLTVDTLWSVRAGQLVSVVAPSNCFYWHHGPILLTPLITLLTLLTTSTDTTDCFYWYYWLLLPILLTTDWLSDYFF